MIPMFPILAIAEDLAIYHSFVFLNSINRLESMPQISLI